MLFGAVLKAEQSSTENRSKIFKKFIFISILFSVGSLPKSGGGDEAEGHGHHPVRRSSDKRFRLKSKNWKIFKSQNFKPNCDLIRI